VEFTPEQIKEWIGLGVGGGIALMIFWFYRIDRRHSEDQSTATSNAAMKMEERALDVLTANAVASQKMAGALDGLARSLEVAEKDKVQYFNKILDRLQR
jgi:hypothetical protein